MKVSIALLFVLIAVTVAQQHGSRVSSGMSNGGHRSSGGQMGSGRVSSSSGVGHRAGRSPQHMSGGMSRGHSSGGMSGGSRGHSSAGMSGGSRGFSSGGGMSHGGHRAGRSLQHGSQLSSGHMGVLSAGRSLQHGGQLSSGNRGVLSAGQLGGGIVSGGHRRIIAPSHVVSRLHD